VASPSKLVTLNVRIFRISPLAGVTRVSQFSGLLGDNGGPPTPGILGF
jgi:hypothetical protein